MAPSHTLSPRWHTSQDGSPSYRGGDSSDDEDLTDRIRAVHLSSASPAPTEDWQPAEHILSDLSTADFDRQALANSRAASQAMAHIPTSIAYHARSPPPPVEERVVPPAWATQSRRHPPPTSISTSTRPPQPDFVDEWFKAPPQHTLNDPTPDAWRYRDPVLKGWRQPRFQPGHKHAEVAARDRLAPPVMGGKSKKDQLGSVNASWGELGEAGPKVYGMFEIEQDPPSRSTSPFKEGAAKTEEDEVKLAKQEIRAARVEGADRVREGMRLAGGSDWSAGEAVAVGNDGTPMTTSTGGRGGRYDEPTPLRYVNSAFGSHRSRSDMGGRDDYAHTPQSTASRDVFGPRRVVRGGDDGW